MGTCGDYQSLSIASRPSHVVFMGFPVMIFGCVGN